LLLAVVRVRGLAVALGAVAGLPVAVDFDCLDFTAGFAAGVAVCFFVFKFLTTSVFLAISRLPGAFKIRYLLKL
jgi:hypothetical protein